MTPVLPVNSSENTLFLRSPFARGGPSTAPFQHHNPSTRIEKKNADIAQSLLAINSMLFLNHKRRCAHVVSSQLCRVFSVHSWASRDASLPNFALRNLYNGDIDMNSDKRVEISSSKQTFWYIMVIVHNQIHVENIETHPKLPAWGLRPQHFNSRVAPLDSPS